MLDLGQIRPGEVFGGRYRIERLLKAGGMGAVHATPGPVAGLADVVQLATGWRHACARTSSGAVRCWGDNAFGQLGDGTTTPRAVPVAIPGKFTAIATGRNDTCGVREDKTLCWGRNEEGQLGDGTLTNRLEATPVRW